MKQILKYNKTLAIISIITCMLACNVSAGKEKPRAYNLIYLQKTYNDLETINNETGELCQSSKCVNVSRIGVFSNDSIYIFDDFPESVPILYSLKRVKDNLILTIQNKTTFLDSLVYTFDQDKNIIMVNDNIYYLNKEYFKYLQTQGHEKKNIIPLLSFLIPKIENFDSLEPLINNMWFKNELASSYRILKAEVYTESPHSDSKYKWNVSYIYDDTGNITSVRKMSQDDKSIYYDLELVSKEDERYYYDIFYIDDGDRYSEKIKRYVNRLELSDSIYVERQQGGFTYRYINETLKRSNYFIDRLDMDTVYIQNVIAEKL